jgi:hypothetical protein
VQWHVRDEELADVREAEAQQLHRLFESFPRFPGELEPIA